jgi:hypothetical protein
MLKEHSKTSDPAVGSTRLVRMRRDRDVLALERCCKALDRSTSPKMLKANLDFLVDRYITHPNYLFRRKEFGLSAYWPRNAELLATALLML